MSDLFPERLEPLGATREPVSQQTERDSGRNPRRRPPPPTPDEIEVVDEESDEPPHQVDRLA
jgi:hypothetical protein